jgi:large subunit ribosomal protein L18
VLLLLLLQEKRNRKGTNVDVATVGKLVAEKALKVGIEVTSIEEVLYHGRIKSLAEGARAAGLKSNILCLINTRM